MANYWNRWNRSIYCTVVCYSYPQSIWKHTHSACTRKHYTWKYVSEWTWTGGENIPHFPRGPPPRGIASIPQIEYFQIAFIGLYATLSLMISRKQKVADKK